MATIYKFEVKAVSAFKAYHEDVIKEIIENALNNFVDENTGLTLESIEIKSLVK
jgi:hypothetical protein